MRLPPRKKNEKKIDKNNNLNCFMIWKNKKETQAVCFDLYVNQSHKYSDIVKPVSPIKTV